MTIEISDALNAELTDIAAYLTGLDGNERTLGDVIEVAVGTLESQRPDILAAMARNLSAQKQTESENQEAN